jgi:hypothetical protein
MKTLDFNTMSRLIFGTMIGNDFFTINQKTLDFNIVSGFTLGIMEGIV